MILILAPALSTLSPASPSFPFEYVRIIRASTLITSIAAHPPTQSRALSHLIERDLLCFPVWNIGDKEGIILRSHLKMFVRACARECIVYVCAHGMCMRACHLRRRAVKLTPTPLSGRTQSLNHKHSRTYTNTCPRAQMLAFPRPSTQNPGILDTPRYNRRHARTCIHARRRTHTSRSPMPAHSRTHLEHVADARERERETPPYLEHVADARTSRDDGACRRVE